MTKSHGHTKDGKLSPTYTTWWNMVSRCKPTTTNADNIKYYVSKGITVHPAWLKFDNFLEDMGPKPGPGYTIDRADSTKNYEPGNCRWVTQHEQRLNNTPRQHCPYGHEYTPENTVLIDHGRKRRCKECSKRYRLDQKERALASH